MLISHCRSPTEHSRQCPSWNSVHEINRVEESKHGFRTSIKRLLQRRPSPRESPVDNMPPCKGGSLKRSKAGGEGGEGVHQKRTLSFKSLLRKKGASSGEKEACLESPRRPESLPLITCYCRKQGGQTNGKMMGRRTRPLPLTCSLSASGTLPGFTGQ